MAKQLVTIIDSAGQIHERKLSWVLRKSEQKLCSLDCKGRWVFRPHNQTNVGKGPLSLRGGKARVALGSVQRAPAVEEPVPVTFLSYPYACQTSGSSMRSRYPGLAQEGAGLGR